jgi:cell division protein ZapA
MHTVIDAAVHRLRAVRAGVPGGLHRHGARHRAAAPAGRPGARRRPTRPASATPSTSFACSAKRAKTTNGWPPRPGQAGRPGPATASTPTRPCWTPSAPSSKRPCSARAKRHNGPTAVTSPDETEAILLRHAGRGQPAPADGTGVHQRVRTAGRRAAVGPGHRRERQQGHARAVCAGAHAAEDAGPGLDRVSPSSSAPSACSAPRRRTCWPPAASWSTSTAARCRARARRCKPCPASAARPPTWCSTWPLASPPWRWTRTSSASATAPAWRRDATRWKWRRRPRCCRRVPPLPAWMPTTGSSCTAATSAGTRPAVQRVRVRNWCDEGRKLQGGLQCRRGRPRDMAKLDDLAERVSTAWCCATRSSSAPAPDRTAAAMAVTAERDSLRRAWPRRARASTRCWNACPPTAAARSRPMSAMKQVEVTILGQVYMLGCPEGGETLLARRRGQRGQGNDRHPRRRQGQGARTHRRAGGAEPGLPAGREPGRARAQRTARRAATASGDDDIDALLRRIDAHWATTASCCSVTSGTPRSHVGQGPGLEWFVRRVRVSLISLNRCSLSRAWNIAWLV